MTDPLTAPTHRAGRFASWSAPVVSSRYVDGSRAALLARLEIHTVGDLIGHVPYRYLDLTSTYSLLKAPTGAEATVVGRVHDIKVKKPRSRLTIVEVAIVDGTGVLLGVWFNQAYMADRFRIGESVAFAGTVEFDFGFKKMTNPYVERLDNEDEVEDVTRIIPVHRSTEGLTKNWLRRLICAAVEDFSDIPDPLPSDIREELDLVSLHTAYRDIHFPKTMRASESARRRLVFDEFLMLQLGLFARRHAAVEGRRGFAHETSGPKRSALDAAVPFNPTDDQSAAIRDVLSDMSGVHPMNRMLMGDVGTGKTLVAAHALAAAADSGSQAAMMAPTEVLAQQYSEKVGPWLDAANIEWGCVTGATTAAERQRLLDCLEDGTLQVLFGTHALIEKSVSFKNLTLAIVDEQHRFGVAQRLALREKGGSADLLVMSATPIPRSLALTLYGDLAVSYLRQRPHGAGAPRVSTSIIDKRHRSQAYDRIREAVSEGYQAYVVCALVEESDTAQAKAATDEATRLSSEVFPGLRVAVLTGRMRSDEKTATMNSFRSGEIDVLVSTTVIEVGVDVPNATVMIVEDAERFGLAQLHQLRGRVGRGESAGEFMLFADPKTDGGRARMRAIADTNDGFELAERDLVLRGEGQILGDRQHGMPELRVASIVFDGEILQQARGIAKRIIESDPALEHPANVPLGIVARDRFSAAWEWVSSG
ncbi:MAG: ATP-dependent DNA helicase RecG [Actinomycetota bacterium]|jgi:ATP-dependent DNA helicase RecG|nr:ATP-dependent DNA helicase RecG [Actinomycetota bacterium]